MYNENEKASYLKQLAQMGVANPSDADALLDFIYALSTIVIDTIDKTDLKICQRRTIQRTTEQPKSGRKFVLYGLE
ncbi:MAG: hypothetical protein MJZ04_00315 [Bacteroidales bacterium]|nr:hypothetical protein [Bacteroidales bacterium]